MSVEFAVQNNGMAKAKVVGLWLVQIALAVFFIKAGVTKLLGLEMSVQGFDVIGFGQWFRYFTGGIEAGAGVLLLIPATAGLGALLLVFTMIGAVLTHLFILGGSFAMALLFLAVSAFIVVVRRREILKLVGR